jgi:surface carbohydrate biosynthesis protein (TIGR04326 family)
MHLVVIATDAVRLPSLPGSWTLRLAGTPELDETAPPHILETVDKAAAEVRQKFPEWLWQWVSDSGALELASFSGPVSWWWYTPLSEKSPLRSRLIREFYWLTLMRRVFESYKINHVEWFGDDPLIGKAVGRIADEYNTSFKFNQHGARPPSLARALVRRALYSVFSLVRVLLVKAILYASAPPNDADVLLFTRFPVLWERREGPWRERMFGGWPDYLAANQHRAVFAAICSASLGELARQWRLIRERCRRQSISILESRISLLSLVRAHFTGGLFWRYSRWRRRVRSHRVEYDGFVVTDLWWREFDLGLLSSEIPLDLTITAGFKAVVDGNPGLRTVFLPFEYQPMERAVWSGVKSRPEIRIVGLQTGLFVSNQMGFSFPRAEMKNGTSDVLKSPLPDFLAAYGELPYQVFVERLGESRVCLSGPIRYSHLHPQDVRGAGLHRSLNLPEATVFILLATSIAREESVPLLEATLRAAAEWPQAFLLIKFHYHLPLHRELAELAAAYGINRYQVFDSDLYSLMRESRVTICAGSSVGIEAIAFNCMPLVFRSLGEMSANPMLDVPQAVFFWHSIPELRSALQSCLNQDEEYQRRKLAWPKAIRDHLFDLSLSPDQRLYEFLHERAIL